MSQPRKVIDVSAVLGVKVLCEDVPPDELLDAPFSAEMHFLPGAKSARHVHPRQDESYRVLAGKLDLFLDGQWHTLRPGQSLDIPKGKVHAFRNSTNEITKAVNTHDPGLRFQEYLEVMEKLIQEGKVTSMTGPRSGIYLSLHSREFRDVAVTTRPPDWFIKLMARIGRALGYKL